MNVRKSMVQSMFFHSFFPSLAATGGLALGGIADAVVIGNRMGEAGLAAIAFTWPIYMIFNILSVGIGTGASIYYARYLSNGEVKRALSLFNGCMLFCAIAGVAIAALGSLLMPQVLDMIGAGQASAEVREMTRQYLQVLFLAAPLFMIRMLFYFLVRADDSQMLATAGMIIGNVVDIVLSCIFVFAWNMGVKGVVYATVIGTGLVTFIYILKMIHRASILRFSKYKPHMKDVLKAYRTGFAFSSQYLFQFLTIMVINQLLIRTGGQTDVAIYNVITNVSYVALAVAEAAVATIYPMVSTFYGERNYKAVKETYRLAQATASLIGIPIIMLLYIFADLIAVFFGLTSHVGDTQIRIFCLSILFSYANLIMSSFYQATENAKRGAVIIFMRSFAVTIICSVACTLIPGGSFWWSFLLTEVVTLAFWGAYNVSHKELYYLPAEDEEKRTEIVITNEKQDVSAALEQVREFCEKLGADVKQTYYVTLVMEEICGAIIANAFTEENDKYIVAVLYADTNDFVFSIRDNCLGYNPFSVRSDRLKDLEDEETIDNMGILLVKNKAKDFFYRRYQGFNTLVIHI